MKLIVGLGNPGDIYKDTRHNIGFRLIKTLAKDRAVVLKRDWGTHALSAKTRVCGEKLIMATPLTYMNLSGKAVKALARKHKIDLNDILVVVDDMELEPGRQRIRPGGSSGGHKGLESVASSLGSTGFARLRIGIGRPGGTRDSAEYVLTPFLKKEKETIDEAIIRARECCLIWACEGIDTAMTKCNRRSGHPAISE